MINKDDIIKSLKEDKNSFSVCQIQSLVQDKVITWNDFEVFFSQDQIDSMIRYTYEVPFIQENIPLVHQKGFTDIYFWGFPCSGKTCALDALLRVARQQGTLTAATRRDQAYLDNLFNQTNTSYSQYPIFNLPAPTSRDYITNLSVLLRDKYKVNFITFSGDVDMGIWQIRNNFPLTDGVTQSVQQVMSYVQNDYNNKIHIFVLDYGAAKNYVHELEPGFHVVQEDILSDIAYFLSQKNNAGGLFKSTIGVYVLVTKADLMPCTTAERPKVAYEYVTTQLPSFWFQLKHFCEIVGIKNVRIIPFSIGDIFAQSLCKFDPSSAETFLNCLFPKPKLRKTLFNLIEQYIYKKWNN